MATYDAKRLRQMRKDGRLPQRPAPHRHVLYECGICDCYHPWDWAGDCREDANRYGSPEDYAAQKRVSIYAVEVRSMEDRLREDAS